jgi:ABC-2 type transport system ATP-binding protein
MTPAIRCVQLDKVYDARKRAAVHALRGLDLEVRTGECFGLLGPNGAGKTTTIEILEGLLPQTSGEVEVLGMRWNRDESALRARIGISLQETKLADKLTAYETIRLFRSFYPRGFDPQAVLEMVGLTDKRNAWVQKLSGGQRQRLAVACALVGEPDLLFLDEPTTGLDPQARRALWDIILQERRRGATVVLTTHYMDEAERLCDRVAIVDLGKVIALGTPRELIASLHGDHVVEFSLQPAVGTLPGAARGALRDDRRDADGLATDSLVGLDAVESVRRDGGSYALTVKHPHVAIPSLLRFLDGQPRPLAHLTTRHASLEDVFVSLTGRHLTDETEEVTQPGQRGTPSRQRSA